MSVIETFSVSVLNAHDISPLDTFDFSDTLVFFSLPFDIDTNIAFRKGRSSGVKRKKKGGGILLILRSQLDTP